MSELFPINKSEPLAPSEALVDKWEVEPGSIYNIASQRGYFSHRIMCGDSIHRSDVLGLFRGSPPAVDVILTDPPYSSGSFQEGGKSSTSSIGTKGERWGGFALERDNLSTSGYLSLMALALCRVQSDRLYCFTDWRMWEWTKQASEAAGYPARQMLIWLKGSMGMGTDYRQEAELCFYGRNGKGELKGSRGNVIQCKRSGNEHHPTEKPVELLRELLQLGSPSTCYDPFAGSGSTLIACELERIQFFGMEVAPEHVAACLERCSRFGLDVKKEEL